MGGREVCWNQNEGCNFFRENRLAGSRCRLKFFPRGSADRWPMPVEIFPLGVDALEAAAG